MEVFKVVDQCYGIDIDREWLYYVHLTRRELYEGCFPSLCSMLTIYCKSKSFVVKGYGKRK